MQLQGETEDLGFCLSFDCYFSDSLTASAAAKVICELKHDQQASPFYEFTDLDEADFEFSLDEDVSRDHQQINLEHQQFVFPDFDSPIEETNDASPEYSSSSFSSGEGDESYECKPSGMFCLWRTLAKCKMISSAGSRSRGSRRWPRVLKSLRWSNSNSEVEESVLVKKTDSSKERRRVNTLEVAKVAGKVKTMVPSPSFHELFYLQKRVERKSDKMKSFLPYKQDLLARVFC